MATAQRASSSATPREYIRFEIVDFNCKALSKTVPGRHRNTPVYMYAGAIASGANSEVVTMPEEILIRLKSEVLPKGRLVPDWSTEQVLPWACRPGVLVKRVYCEQLANSSQSATKNRALPRTVCARLLDELRRFDNRGLEMLVGGELEFTVAKPGGDGSGSQAGDSGWVPMFQGVDVFATLQTSKASDYFYDLEREMEAVGVDILTINAEYGLGQLEVTFAPKFGMEAADATATFRTGAKEIAQRKGLLASFISRPFGMKGAGNGGHFNFSLWCPGRDATSEGDDFISKATRGKTNAMHSSSDAEGLSETARHFLAGVLAHVPALEAVCAPTQPCYTRHGNWAPTASNWGVDDRTACVRVKSDPTGVAGGCYMELRLPSASANPYLVTAALVAAGLDGLQRKLELPAPRQVVEQGAVPLPTTLEEALSALEKDVYMVEKLGADFVRWFTGVKRSEMKAIEARLDGTSRSDADVAAAWRHMYFEYV